MRHLRPRVGHTFAHARSGAPLAPQAERHAPRGTRKPTHDVETALKSKSECATVSGYRWRGAAAVAASSSVAASALRLIA
jgi:hypothetical protein